MSSNRKDPPNNRNNNDKNKKPKGNIFLTLVITAAIALIIFGVYNMINKSRYTETTYSDFLTAMHGGQLEEVQFKSDRIIYLTKEEAAKPNSQQKACYTGLPSQGGAEDRRG